MRVNFALCALLLVVFGKSHVFAYSFFASKTFQLTLDFASGGRASKAGWLQAAAQLKQTIDGARVLQLRRRSRLHRLLLLQLASKTTLRRRQIGQYNIRSIDINEDDTRGDGGGGRRREDDNRDVGGRRVDG